MPNSWRQGLFGCFDDRETCEYFTLYCTHNKVMGKKLHFDFWGRIFFLGQRDNGLGMSHLVPGLSDPIGNSTTYHV